MLSLSVTCSNCEGDQKIFFKELHVSRKGFILDTHAHEDCLRPKFGAGILSRAKQSLRFVTFSWTVLSRVT